MTGLEEYSIRLRDLKEGHHEFRYQLGNRFFIESDNDVFKEGDIDCQLSLEKHGSLITMDFHLKGFIKVPCDRCLTEIELPVEGSFQIVLKFREDANPDDMTSMEDSGIIWIAEDIVEFALQDFLRDFTLLMVPPRLVYDCRSELPVPCDEEVLDRIGYTDFSEEKIINNPAWDALKSIRWEK